MFLPFYVCVSMVLEPVFFGCLLPLNSQFSGTSCAFFFWVGLFSRFMKLSDVRIIHCGDVCRFNRTFPLTGNNLYEKNSTDGENDDDDDDGSMCHG